MTSSGSAPYPGVYPRYHPEGLDCAVEIRGTCAPGFESIRDVFAENFKSRCERGGGICVFHGGEKVVDLWAGERYLNEPWEEGTLVNVFSATKGLAALGLALLHSRGLLDYDERVGAYWPAFACNGKEDVTVRQLLSHSVGVACIDTALSLEDLRDFDTVGQALASTSLEWGADAEKNGYMGVNIGWYDDMLCRRIDPEGRSIADLLKNDLFAKIGLQQEFFCGLPDPDVLDRGRIASLNGWKVHDLLLRGKLNPDFIWNFALRPSSYCARAFSNPKATGDPRAYGTEAIRQCVIPAANGHVTARALAGAYDAILAAGRGDGAANAAGFTRGTLELLSEPVQSRFDEVMRQQSAFSLGFSKPAASDDWSFGSSDRAFGTPGAGGSLGFADPDADLAYGYVTNRMGLHGCQDPRELALRAEVYACLARMGRPSRPQPPDRILARHLRDGTAAETHWADPLIHSSAAVVAAALAAAAAAYVARCALSPS